MADTFGNGWSAQAYSGSFSIGQQAYATNTTKFDPYAQQTQQMDVELKYGRSIQLDTSQMEEQAAIYRRALAAVVEAKKAARLALAKQCINVRTEPVVETIITDAERLGHREVLEAAERQWKHDEEKLRAAKAAAPAPAPHDFSNPYLRLGQAGPLLCCKCGTYGPMACDPTRITVPVQTYVEACKDADRGFALTTEWHPPRQRLPRPDAWQSSALMGGAWDLASAERRDGTRGRKRLPPR